MKYLKIIVMLIVGGALAFSIPSPINLYWLVEGMGPVLSMIFSVLLITYLVLCAGLIARAFERPIAPHQEPHTYDGSYK
jgi:polyferredoxin